jgi:GR25 family glycosyltransferase involved in LPS biosynthesis
VEEPKAKKKQVKDKDDPTVRYLVINLDRSPDRLAKYQDEIARQRVIRIKAINFTESVIDQYVERQINLPQIRPENKRKNVACILSHLKALSHIVEHKLNDIVILEDDTCIDFDRMERIAPTLSRQHVTQVGGHLWPPIFSTKGWKKPTFEEGVHEIDLSRYHIMGAHGYYVPTWEVAKQLVDWIHAQKRWRNYDNLIEKSPQKRYFVFPAVVTLYVQDANCSTMDHKWKYNDCCNY